MDAKAGKGMRGITCGLSSKLDLMIASHTVTPVKTTSTHIECRFTKTLSHYDA